MRGQRPEVVGRFAHLNGDECQVIRDKKEFLPVSSPSGIASTRGRDRDSGTGSGKGSDIHLPAIFIGVFLASSGRGRTFFSL